MERTWARVQGTLREKLGAQNYEIWIRPVQALPSDADELRLRVPNRYYRDWVMANYGSLLTQVMTEAHGRPVHIDYLVGPVREEDDEDVGDEPTPIHPPTEDDGPGILVGISRDKTFENFVVGASNQLACAAAKAVCDSPGDPAYNPLFIYGATGLGKTHLMYAIANRVLSMSPGATVMYVTSEQFTNDMIHAIRYQRMAEFRDKYRTHPGFLLMDDVQFLGGKDRTQEELFHTFEWLRERGRQIVFTADVLPREIKMLEPRLRTRCEGGMIADVQPPDMETLLAILQVKAEALNLEMPSDLAHYIGTRVQGSVRELEGVLNRLKALRSVHHTVLSVEFAKKHLGPVLTEEPSAPTTDAIIQTVANFYNIKVSDLKGQRRLKQLVRPRHVAMFLIRNHTDLSFPEIGRLFGNRDHATVQHACKKIQNQLQRDADLRNAIATLDRSLGR